MNQYLVEHQQSRCFSHIPLSFLTTHFKAKKEISPKEPSEDSAIIPLSIPDATLHCFRSIDDLPIDWDHLVDDRDIFLERAYLHHLENHPPHGLGFVYLLFYYQNEPVGLAYCQTYTIDLGRSIRDYSSGFFLGEKIKAWIGKTFSFNMLICGNSLLSGQHHLLFDDALVKADFFFTLVEEGIGKTADWLGSKGQKVDVLMVKDLKSPEKALSGKLDDNGFHLFPFQPSMVLHLESEWQTFEDYLSAMTSKYRVRVRRAFKKGKVLKRVELDVEHLDTYKDKLHELYQEVAEKADFSLLDLHPDYLPELKRTFKDELTILAYFVEGELVGYCTTLENGDELEAHFLGINESANYKYQLYLNMLYDMVKIGIDAKMDQIVFSRTALEIKSSVGAVPTCLSCYLRHQNGFLNRFLPFFVNYMEPEVSWKQRHPFKNVEPQN